MKHGIWPVALLGALVGVCSAAHACGDKFLIVGRCVNYQRTHMAEHPGSVLILWGANSKTAAAIRDVQLQNFLQQAGHRVNVVEESPGTLETFRAGDYDVVLVDAADADRVRLELVGARTRVLPVMYQATDAQMDQVRQNYRHALNIRRAAIKRNQLLVALDGAIGRR